MVYIVILPLLWGAADPAVDSTPSVQAEIAATPEMQEAEASAQRDTVAGHTGCMNRCVAHNGFCHSLCESKFTSDPITAVKCSSDCSDTAHGCEGGCARLFSTPPSLGP